MYPFGNTSFIYAQAPTILDQGGIGQRGSGAEQFNPVFVDTVDRPPLLVAAYPIHNLSEPLEILDTLPETLHLFEPAYLAEHLIPNLGSENSAAQWQPWILPQGKIGFGHNQYDGLFDLLREANLVKVNRSYGDISVAEGLNSTRPLLSSRHFNTRFFRSFARDIHLNFNYKSYTDQGQSFPRNVRAISQPQMNSARYIDLKFFQESKSGNRISYVQYDNPNIVETINRDIYSASSTDTLMVERNDRTLIFGNRISPRQDSVQRKDWIWDSRLIFKRQSYTTFAENLVKSNEAFLPIDLILEDSLNYNHELSRTILENEFSTDLLGGQLKVGLDLSSLRETFAKDTLAQSYFTAISSLAFGKRVGVVDLYSSFNFGLGDASDYRGASLRAVAGFNKIKLDLSLSTQDYIAPLDSRSVVINSRLIRRDERPAISEFKVAGELLYVPTETSLSFAYSNTSNLISIGQDGLFTSITDRIGYLRAQVEQSLILGPFHTSHSLLIQSLDDTRFSVPTFSYRGDIHVKRRIFKKIMLVHLGADIHYLTSFDTPEFYALTGLFYNEQISDSGGVVLVHPYLNAKVQSFQFFVKGVNALHRLRPFSQVSDSAGNVSAARDLPTVTGFTQFDFRIRFGIKWYFLN